MHKTIRLAAAGWASLRSLSFQMDPSTVSAKNAAIDERRPLTNPQAVGARPEQSHL
jgi:hypothetical protein